MGRDQFNTIQVALQQHFWPSVTDFDMALAQTLNGINIGIGGVAALIGGPIAGVGKELATGLIRAVGLASLEEYVSTGLSDN
jgi:hypothetical protein